MQAFVYMCNNFYARLFCSFLKVNLFCVCFLQNIQGMTGTPMVATSPERHDGGLQANPVEVQTYQPPWKVLSDFALQSDIDQPAFQQLVRARNGRA